MDDGVRDLPGDGGDVCVGGGGRGGRRYVGVVLFRCFFTILFSLTASFFLSFLFGVVAIVLGTFSNSSAVSIATECRILSSGVDLRSSKVCELGVSNYRAKHVLHPPEKTRVRCRDDYYWASIFKVEYREYFSGRTLHAVSETPKEALPLDCRPSFGMVWVTKSKFKVNETFKCRYSPGSDKADIYQNDLFNCQAKDPSTMELVRRLFALSLSSFPPNKGRGWRIMRDMVSGIVTGMLYFAGLVVAGKTIHAFKLLLVRNWDAGKHHITILSSHLRRACFIIVYISVMGWLTFQYSKLIGLNQLLFNTGLGERTR